MKKASFKTEKRERRRRRIRAKVKGVGSRPRLSVFRSGKFLCAQLIDDERGHTLASVSTREAKGGKPLDRAREAGKLIAKRALGARITKVVFDRGGYVYAGRIKALAEGAREGGVVF